MLTRSRLLLSLALLGGAFLLLEGAFLLLRPGDHAGAVALLAALLFAGGAASLLAGLRTRRDVEELAAELRETMVSRDHLEATVAERTAALESSRAELARRLGQLETTRGRLGAADRLAAVGRLSRGLTHELNNPLAIVKANLEYLRDEILETAPEGPRREEHVEALDEAITAGKRMTQIVRDLSAFSREPGNDQGPADLASVLEYVRRLVGPSFREQVRLELDLPSSGPVPVRGSAATLGHVFSRLVLDAVAAYPPGTPVEQATVRVHVRGEGPDVVVEVHDSGETIPQELLPHVFDPFYTPRAGFTAGQGGRGVGVGLAACYGLVEGAGGTIGVESDPASGTHFRVRLRAAGSDTRVALRGAAAPGARGRKRVLAVHEDPLALAGLYRLLGERYDVAPHPSPRHALTLLQARERFDAVVCDAGLTELTPSAFHRALASARPELAGATVFIVDPAAVPEFLAALANPRVGRPPGRELLDEVARVTGDGGVPLVP